MAKVNAAKLRVGDVVWDKTHFPDGHPWLVIARDDTADTLTFENFTSHPSDLAVKATVEPEHKTGSPTWVNGTSYLTETTTSVYQHFRQPQFAPMLIPGTGFQALDMYGRPMMTLTGYKLFDYEMYRCGTVKQNKMTDILS